MIIVSNTGPIIALSKVGYVNLLKEVSKEVRIPPVVHRELLGKIGSESEHIDRALNDFIQLTEISSFDKKVEIATADLDEGEKQAIGLAFTYGKDALLLMDDYAGRNAARKLNIPTTGVIGVLIMAKEKGVVEDVGRIIEDIRFRGYWLSDELINIAKRLAKER
jgi:uncharacterized protein